ncbi:Uncharacterised protein [Vibrio cholerae]|uniref:Uncharacterized protein n=1 Tax=Vibrio cholerae TaxID=666 RepID=A0A655RJI3_VIBCL|nr:Uncharacterised protein [Vibrio cholerae]
MAVENTQLTFATGHLKRFNQAREQFFLCAHYVQMKGYCCHIAS